MPDAEQTPDTLKDANGVEWTRDEVQAMVNQVGSFTTAAARLGLPNTNVLRAFGIKTPPEYIRDRAAADVNWLPRFCIMMGSVGEAAKHLNVSAAHIETILKGLGYEVRMPLPDHDQCLAALKKFGSVLYVARLFHTTPALVKKAVPEWREHQDGTKVGDTSTRTGTIGERYYAQLRAELITASPAETNHNHRGYDYEESEYGRVNVKAIPQLRDKWVWELDPMIDCDGFALVQLSPAKVPVGMVMLTKAQLTSMEPPPGMVATPRSNRDIAISTKELFTYQG